MSGAGKITVVTAAYNAARFLPDCLDSIEQQNPSQFELEHLIVDGGSTDGTLDLLRTRPKVRWISEPDRGQADAFNKGVSLSDAEWICWLNADDLLTSNAVTSFARAINGPNPADVVYGHVQFVDENLAPTWVCYHLPFWYPLIWYGCYSPPSSGTFFRRELLLKEPLDIDYHYVMDVEWFLRCGPRIRALAIDSIFSKFRISSQAKTSEMIRSGRINERHAAERERYRRKHVYSRWPQLTHEQAQDRFALRRKYFRLLYLLLKTRYLPQYSRNRLANIRARHSAESSSNPVA
jgi:glycosyltransferase involved in cell wall biosynthesis